MYDGIIANETTSYITLRGGSEGGDETVLRKNIADDSRVVGLSHAGRVWRRASGNRVSPM